MRSHIAAQKITQVTEGHTGHRSRNVTGVNKKHDRSRAVTGKLRHRSHRLA